MSPDSVNGEIMPFVHHTKDKIKLPGKCPETHTNCRASMDHHIAIMEREESDVADTITKPMTALWIMKKELIEDINAMGGFAQLPALCSFFCATSCAAQLFSAQLLGLKVALDSKVVMGLEVELWLDGTESGIGIGSGNGAGSGIGLKSGVGVGSGVGLKSGNGAESGIELEVAMGLKVELGLSSAIEAGTY